MLGCYGIFGLFSRRYFNGRITATNGFDSDHDVLTRMVRNVWSWSYWDFFPYKKRRKLRYDANVAFAPRLQLLRRAHTSSTRAANHRIAAERSNSAAK